MLTDSKALELRPEDTGALTEHAVEQQEHAAAVLRMRSGLRVAAVMCVAFALADWLVATFIQPTRLWLMLGLRAALLAVILAVLMRVSRLPLPSRRTFVALDLLLFTTGSVTISLMCLEFGGIASPYFGGVILVLICRGAIMPERRRRALALTAPVAAAFPLTMMIAAFTSARIRDQFADPAARFTFMIALMGITASYVVLALGGHTVWALRRQVFERRVVGRYRLQRKIGAGGMGEVWLAHHAALKREVAVKILRHGLTADGAQSVSRFEREVRAMTELVHPNTVRVFDYGTTEDGVWYYVMELLAGETLAAVVRREGPLPAGRAIYLVHQVARALGEAHSRGIVHRDVKPENVFITSIGRERDFVKVLDFGIAKVTGDAEQTSLTATGRALGTPAYISPEAASGKAVDPRADVYSLGALLYFAVAGHPPFRETDARSLLIAHVHFAPVAPSTAEGKSPPRDLEDVIMRCLAKDPAARFRDGSEVAAALAGCEDFAQWVPTAGIPLESSKLDSVDRAAETRTEMLVSVDE
jgi:tRNA A-37 threonylcarbamoyl transferase component Bud32